MGSIAMDKVGDIALGYSASSTSVVPSIRYTGRIPTDAAGTMEAENIVKAGGGSQLAPSAVGVTTAQCRWTQLTTAPSGTPMSI